MNSIIRGLAAIAGPILMFSLPGQALATSTDVVLNLEGNPTCSSLADNSAIIEARDSDLDGVATGPTGQTFEYSIVEGSPDSLSWSTGGDLPVNFVILKSQGNAGARVFHFGATGTFSDIEEEATGNLTAVSFCYGLTGDPVPPSSDPINLGNCDNLSNQNLLDGTGISCATLNTDQQRMLISLDITPTNGDPNARPDFNVQFCTCNVPGDGLPTCDPDLSRGEQGACTNNPIGTNTRVPVVIQGVENPSSYICYTIGGNRVCYGHF